MSYDISLTNDEGVPLPVENHTEGATFAMGGIEYATTNITYNYSWFYRQFIDKKEGISWLDGKTGKGCLERLKRAIAALGTDRYDDYWAPTPGNAGHALSILVTWAEQHPDGIFEVQK
jgi:hypothetical protein